MFCIGKWMYGWITWEDAPYPISFGNKTAYPKEPYKPAIAITYVPIAVGIAVLLKIVGWK